MSFEKKFNENTHKNIFNEKKGIIKSRLDDEEFVAEKDYSLREMEVEYNSDLSNRDDVLFESKKMTYYENALMKRLTELS